MRCKFIKYSSWSHSWSEDTYLSVSWLNNISNTAYNISLSYFNLRISRSWNTGIQCCRKWKEC